MYKVSKEWQDKLYKKEWPIPVAVIQTQTGNRIFAKESVPEITNILLNKNRAGYETESDRDSSWNFRYNFNGDFGTANTVIAQSFKLNITTTINTIELLLKRIGSPLGNLYIEMEVGPTEPSGTVRYTSENVNVSSINKEGFSWVSFPLNTELNIVKDEVNWIELHGTYDISKTNYIEVGIDTSNGYMNGDIGEEKVDQLDGDLVDEDMSDDTGWIDQDSGNGVSTFTTFDGEDVIKFETNTVGGDALRTKETGANIQTTTTVEIKTYFDKIGINANGDGFNCLLYLSTTLLIGIAFASDGLYVNDGSSWNEVGTNIVLQDQWQTWRFIITHSTEASATCTVLLMNEDDESFSAIAFGVDCSYVTTGLTEGKVSLVHHGNTTNDLVSYVSYVKVDDGLVNVGETWEINEVNDIMFRAVGLPPLSFDDNVFSFSQIRRILQPISDTIIKGVTQRQLASTFIRLLNNHRDLIGQIKAEKWIGGVLCIYLYYKDLDETIRIFIGNISEIQLDNKEQITIKAVEDAILTNAYSPRQASEFSDPKNEFDYLPISYGKTNGSPSTNVAFRGRRVLPLIDKDSSRYLIADHAINTTIPTVLVDGVEVAAGSNYNFLNENFNSLAAWTDISDTGNTSSIVTFDGEEALLLEGTEPGNAEVYADLGSIFEKKFTIEVNIYFGANWVSPSVYAFLEVSPSTTFMFRVLFIGTGMFIHMDNDYTLVDDNIIIKEEWQKWKFVVYHDVEKTAYCDIYVWNEIDTNYSQIKSGIPCGWTPGSLTAGRVVLRQQTNSSNYPKRSYFDYIKITGSPWAFNYTEVFEGDTVSSIVFVEDQSRNEVAFFGGGKPANPSVGITTTPSWFVEDFLNTFVESDIEIDQTSKETAQINYDSIYDNVFGYAIYVLDKPQEVWYILQDMMSSVLGVVYISPQDGRIHFIIEGLNPTKDNSLIISRNEATLELCQYNTRDVINYLNIEWPKVYISNIDPNLVGIEQDSQSIRDYGQRNYIFYTKWLHDNGISNSVGVRVVRNEIISFLKEPKYKIKAFVTDPLITLLEPGDHVYMSFDELIGTDGELLRNEWVKIIEVIYKPDSNKVQLVVLDTDQYLTESAGDRDLTIY